MGNASALKSDWVLRIYCILDSLLEIGQAVQRHQVMEV